MRSTKVEKSEPSAHPIFLFPAKWMEGRLSPEVAQELKVFFDQLKGNKGIVENVDMGFDLEEVNKVHRTIMVFELAKTHIDHFGALKKDNYATESLWNHLTEGEKTAPAEYTAALARQQEFKQHFDKLIQSRPAQAILSPTVPKKGVPKEGMGDSSLCSPWTLTGQPAIALPLPASPKDKLANSIQLVGISGRDDALLQVSDWCEYVRDKYQQEQFTNRMIF